MTKPSLEIQEKLNRRADGIKIHLLKQGINWAVPTIGRVVDKRKPTLPVTRLLEKIFSRLYEALEKETVEGGPLREGGGDLGKNFMSLVKTAHKVLTYICEEDCYYEIWMGFTLAVIYEEMQKNYLEFDPMEIPKYVKIDNLNEFLKHPGLRKVLWYWQFSGHLPYLEFQGIEVNEEGMTPFIKQVELNKK